MKTLLRCPQCGAEVTVFVPVVDSWCGRCHESHEVIEQK